MALNVISHRELGKLAGDFQNGELETSRRETRDWTNTRPKVMITAEKVVSKVGLFARRGCKSPRRE